MGALAVVVILAIFRASETQHKKRDQTTNEKNNGRVFVEGKDGVIHCAEKTADDEELEFTRGCLEGPHLIIFLALKILISRHE